MTVLDIIINIIHEKNTEVFKRQPDNFYLQQHLQALGNSDTFLVVVLIIMLNLIVLF